MGHISGVSCRFFYVKGEIKDLFKKLKEKTLYYAKSPLGPWALFANSFAESSFFPIPPDLLQMALSFLKPKKSFSYAFISSIASTIGGILGYLIGLYLMEVVGFPVLRFYNLMDKFELVKKMYLEKDVLIVFTAAFTPIPYKLITITAGAVKLNIVNFVIASFVGRSTRFFGVATIIYFFGEKTRKFLEKYLNLLSIIFFLLLVLGFLVIKYLVK